jgi:hypothetical protein
MWTATALAESRYNGHGLTVDTIRMRLRAGYTVAESVILPKSSFRKESYSPGEIRGMMTGNSWVTKDDLCLVTHLSVFKLNQALAHAV